MVVGLGGGSAIDTAKFIAWKTGKPLIQIPSITSVDAGFTDAIGVRSDGRVRYIGQVLPQYVVLDVELVRSAPKRMNRSGIGDILSCHTGLWDWRFAVEHGQGAAWDAPAASLGRQLLAELEQHVDEINAVTPDAVRWLASAYQRIGAACSALRHSRFEEGSEHFLAYAYEHRTNAHPLHGELIALCVSAMCTLQDNDPEWARSIVVRSGVTANPTDLNVGHRRFHRRAAVITPNTSNVNGSTTPSSTPARSTRLWRDDCGRRWLRCRAIEPLHKRDACGGCSSISWLTHLCLVESFDLRGPVSPPLEHGPNQFEASSRVVQADLAGDRA